MSDVNNKDVRFKRLRLWAVLLTVPLIAVILIAGLIPVESFEQMLTVASFAVLAVFFIYVAYCVLVGMAAANKSRNGIVWAVIAFAFGVVIPAVIIAIMGPSKPLTTGAAVPSAAPTGRKQSHQV